MDKHSRCLLANKECMTLCHSQQMGWPVQCINNESCPNSATAGNEQLVGETPVRLIWLHNVKPHSLSRNVNICLMFSHPGEVHFPRQECAWKGHGDWLTYRSLDLAVAEGLMLRTRQIRQHPYFSAGLSKLDQKTHGGCNYDQPAGVFLDTGWTAAWGPQLFTLQEYMITYVYNNIIHMFIGNPDQTRN